MNTIFRIYVKTRNFLINNFFVDIKCFKKEDKFIYLDNQKIIYKYLLMIIPFYLIKSIANKYNYDIIYKVDNIYNITNIKENHIIPFISNCSVYSNNSVIDITKDIRYYNSSIPLCFLIYNCELFKYDTIKITYMNKGNKLYTEINLNNIDTTNFLLYNLFNK
jgi:hypothetical protein